MNNFFSIFGKIALVSLAVALLVGGGFYVGKKYSPQSNTGQNSSAQSQVAENNSLSQTSQAPTNQTPDQNASNQNVQQNPSPAPSNNYPFVPTTRKVSGGMKSPVFSFYNITVPLDWTDSTHTDTTAKTTRLVLSKGSYSIDISQAAGGGGACIFPGDKASPMAQVFSNGVGITGTTTQFKRGTNDNIAFTICEKYGASYGFPTSFGYITYATPKNSDALILSEMDGIVASISKQ